MMTPVSKPCHQSGLHYSGKTLTVSVLEFVKYLYTICMELLNAKHISQLLENKELGSYSGGKWSDTQTAQDISFVADGP